MTLASVSANILAISSRMFVFKSCVTTKGSETRLGSQHIPAEKIVNIPADMLVRVMANTRNWFIQCMDNGGRHLPDVIFKTV